MMLDVKKLPMDEENGSGEEGESRGHWVAATGHSTHLHYLQYKQWTHP